MAADTDSIRSKRKRQLAKKREYEENKHIWNRPCLGCKCERLTLIDNGRVRFCKRRERLWKKIEENLLNWMPHQDVEERRLQNRAAALYREAYFKGIEYLLFRSKLSYTDAIARIEKGMNSYVAKQTFNSYTCLSSGETSFYQTLYFGEPPHGIEHISMELRCDSCGNITQ